MSRFTPTDAQLRQYQDDGYFLAHGLFDFEEMDLLGKIGRADHQLEQSAASRRDGQGGTIKLKVDNELGDDMASAFVRCRRIVDTVEKLLEGEVYHYHHKMILK